MCMDASVLPCVLLGDSRETDPLGCLQPLIAIISQWKQSIHPTTTLSPQRVPLSLLEEATPANFPSHVSFPSASLYIYPAKRPPYRWWGDVVYSGQGWSGAAVVTCSWRKMICCGNECLIDPVEYCSSISALQRLLLLSPLAACLFPLPCSPSALVSAAAVVPGPGPRLQRR